MKVQLVAVAFLLLLLTTDSRAKDWRGIVPLKSTRADVERLLGKPNHRDRYEFDNERASIYYKKAACNRAKDCECLVPNDTVLYIFVTPEVEMKFSKLNIDRSKYKLTKSTHLLTVVSYSSEREGIIYTVDEDEVTDITYLPSAKDCRELVQKNRQARQRKRSYLQWNCIEASSAKISETKHVIRR